MGEVSTIGLDIAKSVFQVHGVDGAGAVVMRKRVSLPTPKFLTLTVKRRQLDWCRYGKATRRRPVHSAIVNPISS